MSAEYTAPIGGVKEVPRGIDGVAERLEGNSQEAVAAAHRPTWRVR